MPSTLVMFALSKRIGRLADRFGPRLFMGVGPLVAAAGLALMLRIDADLDYFTDLLPALLVFSLGLSLHGRAADRDGARGRRRVQRRHRVGHQQRDRARRGPARRRGASARSSRAQFSSALDERLGGPAALAAPAGGGRARRATRRWRASIPRGPAPASPTRCESASVHAFHVGIGISAALVALGGVLGLAGIRNPRRAVRCEDCAGGQFAGQPLDAAREPSAPRASCPSR